MDTHDRETFKKLTEQKYFMKICLLRELFHCYLEFAPPAEQEEIVDAGFCSPQIMIYRWMMKLAVLLTLQR